jgi:hydroxymethylbilane synthase
VKIGTRGSALALKQASLIGGRLTADHPDLSIDYVIVKTKGDKILDVPLAGVGGKGLFVKEIEEALTDHRADLAVHSVKDIPAEVPSELMIAAIPKREDPRDVLVSRDGASLADLHQGSTVGTSSLRRRAQLLNLRPDLNVVSLRGNLDTRLRKLTSEPLDAIVVAAAGLRRMGLEDRITELLSPDDFLPAVGQGALGLETRVDDDGINTLVCGLDHRETRLCVECERAFLRKLEGGCQVPIGALARIQEGVLHLDGMVADVDGVRVIRDEIQGDPGSPEILGIELAERILNQGGDEILKDPDVI